MRNWGTSETNHRFQPVTCYCSAVYMAEPWQEGIQSAVTQTAVTEWHYPAIYMSCNCKILL